MAIMSFKEWKTAKAAGALKQKPSIATKATEGKQLVSDSALQKSESAMPKKSLRQLREEFRSSAKSERK